MGRPNPKQPHSMGSDANDQLDDLPPSYEASTSGNPPPNSRGARSGSVSSTRSHDGLLPESSPPARQQQPPTTTTGSAQGYQKTDPMAWESRSWDHLKRTPGCCGSSSGGCCFSSRGGCCFSDRGGCCFSDRDGCCFSDRGGCCFGDTGGAWCSTRGACCFSDGPTE